MKLEQIEKEVKFILEDTSFTIEEKLHPIMYFLNMVKKEEKNHSYKTIKDLNENLLEQQGDVKQLEKYLIIEVMNKENLISKLRDKDREIDKLNTFIKYGIKV